MIKSRDFERAWLDKFSALLDAVTGTDARQEVMEGSAELSSHSSRAEIIAWTSGAMQRLETLVDERGRRQILTGCACQYPKSTLQPVRVAYQSTGDLDVAHRMLQEQFELLLRDTLQLDDKLVEEIVGRGWGSAGVRDGNTIMATKIPKSGNLVAYMEEADPEKKRQLYCHCPRVREVLQTSETISPAYCYCGAGFYKGIWEEILQRPVQVEVLKSVLAGDDVCTIVVHLPSAPAT
jgi:predicted hydrocarbon binding protein